MSDTQSPDERRRPAIFRAVEKFHLLGMLPWRAIPDSSPSSYEAELHKPGLRLLVEEQPSGTKVLAMRQELGNDGIYKSVSTDTIRI